MKKIVLILTLVMGAFFAQAQDTTKVHHRVAKVHRTPEQRAAKITGILDKHLNLSDAQEKQVSAIVTSRAKQLAELRANKATVDKKERKERQKAILTDADSKITAVLNDAQKKEYAVLKEKFKSRAKRHAKGKFAS